MGQELVPVAGLVAQDTRAPSRGDLQRLLRALRTLCIEEPGPGGRALEAYRACAAVDLLPVHRVDIRL